MRLETPAECRRMAKHQRVADLVRWLVDLQYPNAWCICVDQVAPTGEPGNYKAVAGVSIPGSLSDVRITLDTVT